MRRRLLNSMGYMHTANLQYKITQLGRTILPPNAHLLLYGSRARGDYHDGSDWDLLLLLPKDHITTDDFNQFAYPFIELGFDNGEYISPQLYTQQEWQTYSYTPFYHNVEQDKLQLL